MKLKTVLSLAFNLWAICGLLSQPVSEDLPKVTDCIALINAKVVTIAGKAPQTSTIIIRDGLITHVGANISIPPDAFRIMADSLFAYPAFIDALSHTGIKSQEGESTPASGSGPPSQSQRSQRPVADAEGNIPLEDAGITPFLSVRAKLDPKEKSIADWRAQGFAIAHVVPKGKMMPGKGAILVLSGNSPDQLIWKEDVSLFSQWTGAGGSYPSTVIGIMAKWRELYYNASNNVAHRTSYSTTSMVSRPQYNQAHDALMPVVKKEIPVFFKATKVKDISRALDLQSDLGMRMVVADAEQAWLVRDQIRARNIPLVLSLGLPEDKSEAKKEKEKAKEEKEKPSSVPAPDSLKTIEGEKPDTDLEKAAFEKRRAESLREHRAQAGLLASESIPFSFGTMSVKTSDFSKNIQLMRENGLSDDQALSALTIQPARLLGIEKNCGSIETGKMANVIVTDKPIFEKETAIRFMIVEGNLYEYEAKEKKKSDTKVSEDVLAAVTGKWDYTIEVPDYNRKGNFIFSTDEGTLTGEITSPEITSGNSELEDIEFEDGKLTFTFDFDMGGQILVLEFSLVIKGETFDGTVVVGELGTFPVTGARISKPDK